MIVTEFYDGQGLGNQLWVYAACRSIASRLGLQHRILSPHKFKGSSFLDIDCDPIDTGQLDSKFQIEKSSFTTYNEMIFYDQELDCFSSDFDSNVLNLKPFTKIHGLFQSEDYFFGDPSQLKNYITIKPDYLQKKLISDDCCLIYIRGGEYKRHKNLILPKAYWENAMRNMRDLFGIDKFVAVTDDDRYVSAMFPKLPLLQGGSMEEDYVALYQARFAILANSSWGYFPVKTGVEKSFVIAPMHWARFGNKFSRWASPANLYESWMWQDSDGGLFDYATCLENKNSTLEYYRQNFHYLVPGAALDRWKLRRLMPPKLRKKVKTGLSHFFPRHIG